MGGQALMARVAVTRAPGAAAGVYRFLAAQEEAERDRWESAQARRTANGYSRQRYPRRVRLEAFAAGLPVNVSTGELWGWAATEAGCPPVQRPVGRTPERAIVRPDDSVAFSDDNWARLFLEESGI